MNYEYENANHFFFVCRKFLFKNGLKLDYDEQQSLKRLTDKVFLFQQKYEDLLYRLELREITRILTYFLHSSYDFDSLFDNLEKFMYIFKRYKEIVKDENVDRSNYKDLYDEYYKPIIIREKHWNSKEKRYKCLSRHILSKQEELIQQHGIYFLYNKEKELIYIGKSVYNLWSRIISSAKEREATYFAYALTKTKSDTSIYEMYYIAKLKPPLNNDGKYNDPVTITLPELEITEPQAIYEEDEEVLLDGKVQTGAC
jgi:hypothetical protein